jgi:hypothetical protein
MKTKIPSIILIICSGLTILFTLLGNLSLLHYQFENVYENNSNFLTLIPLTLLMYGISMYRNTKSNIVGIMLVVSSGFNILSVIKSVINIFSDSYYNSKNSIILFIPLLIALLILGISIIRQVKLVKSGVILIIMSSINLLILLVFLLMEHGLLSNLILLLIPLSLLILGISLTKKNRYDLEFPDSENLPIEQNPPNLKVSDWINIFLISTIPLIGLIFICIWANDDKNKVRKNYAIANLFWMLIVLIPLVILFFAINNN